MGVIQELATDLDVQERTLRRAASQGALRASRSGPRDRGADRVSDHLPATIGSGARAAERARLAYGGA
jgi:hypothetical protein